ncbi:MAG: hypothetical protein QXS54_09495 [Candidatus Methanomethylicaceae archaeon]
MPTHHTKLDEITPTGALAIPEGQKRRTIKLTKAERAALKQRELIEKAAALFLDLETVRTWAQIADELGVSISTLNELTKTKEFDEIYNAMFAELGHDPRYRAMQAEMANILPLAVRELKNIIVSTQTPVNSKLKAIELVFRATNFKAESQQESDRNELINFLRENRVNIENMNVAIMDLATSKRFLGEE